jgi:hypothetical protein
MVMVFIDADALGIFEKEMDVASASLSVYVLIWLPSIIRAQVLQESLFSFRR